MQFLTSLFGGVENTALTAILALGIVLVLIVLGVWALKVFFKASTHIGRGRNRRLSVIDSVAIDPRRQLLIVRRDNVEHLIRTGGPQDVIVESGIPVETPPRPLRQPPPAGGVDMPATTPGTTGSKTQPAEVERTSVRARIERFRDLARPAAARKAVSLRHTGLMRSPGRPEPTVIPTAPDKSEQSDIDSATNSPANDISGQAKRGGGSQFGDAVKAEGQQQ